MQFDEDENELGEEFEDYEDELSSDSEKGFEEESLGEDLVDLDEEISYESEDVEVEPLELEVPAAAPVPPPPAWSGCYRQRG